MQQLAKLSKRMEALAKENTEVSEKVVAKQTELAQLEVELEEARWLIMRPTPPPTPPPSQALRGQSLESVVWLPLSWRWLLSCFFHLKGRTKGSKRLRVSASGEEAPSLQQVLAAQDTFSMQELESIMESFRHRHSLLEQELIASEQRDLEDALG